MMYDIVASILGIITAKNKKQIYIYIYIIKATLPLSGDKDCVDNLSILNSIILLVGAEKRDKKLKKDHSTLNDYSRKVGTVDS